MILENLLDSNRVHFQPPENIRMRYPAIVYQRDSAITRHADDLPYSSIKRYQVTVIDQDPDSAIPDKIAALPLSSFQRHFTADNLNHDVFVVYF
jgi:hypothetical protein